MNLFLFYSSISTTWLAILFYIFAAYFSFKFLVGFGKKGELDSKVWSLVITGSLLMVFGTLLTVAFNLSSLGTWWDPILVVNGIDLLLNAACLHTLYWKWPRVWSAWIAVATVLLDSGLRFIVLMFFG